MSTIASIGQQVMGEYVFNKPYTLTDHQDDECSDGNMRTQRGWGVLSGRAYSKSALWTAPEISAIELTNVEISLTSVSGALVGKIRTDVQKSIVQSLEFTIDENGCADFILKLNKLPEFPILPFSILSVKVANTSYNWYSGEISYKDDQGTKQDVYEYRGVGVREYLKNLRAETTYITGQDVGQIIDDLIKTWVEPYCPINYNNSKIHTTTGVILANDIELSKHPLEKIFQTLADMAGYDWGVDGDNDLYFKDKSETVMRTYFIGYDVQKFEPKLNLSNLKNVITVQRQQGAAAGGAGWSVAGVYNDAASVKKYGRKELNYQIPGYFADDEADIIGDALLDEKKDPVQSAKMKGLVIKGFDQYLELGNYRFIMPFDKFDYLYSDVDSAAEWTKNGAGDLAITKDEDSYVYGDGCLKLTFTTAEDDYATFTSDCNIGKIEKIRFFVKSANTGALLKCGIGYGAWDQYTVDVDIHVLSYFQNYEWDVSDLDITRINYIGFQVNDNQSSEISVLIDKIELEIAGHPYYTLRLKEAKYKIKPKEQAVDAEFGALPPKMENYLSTLFATANELKFTQEIR